MAGHYCVAPDEVNTLTGPREALVYAFEWGDGVAWSSDAVVRIVSEDGRETHDLPKSAATSAGRLLVFTFADAQPGIRYRGFIVDGEFSLELFGLADICAIQHPHDPTSHLPFPSVDTCSTGADGARGDSERAAAGGAVDFVEDSAGSEPVVSDEDARAEIDADAVDAACAPLGSAGSSRAEDA